MRKYIHFSLSLLLVIFSHQMAAFSHNSKLNFIEKHLPAIATFWFGSMTAEALSLAFTPINYALYGNNAISQSSTKIIYDLIKSINQQPDVDIKAARSLWTSLGANAFSHGTTLFINPNIFSTPDFTMTKSLKTEIISSVLAINTHYDRKVFIATILIPVIVWGITHCINKMIQLCNTSESYVVVKATKIMKLLNNSFYAKSLASLSIIAGYMLYQKQLIAKMADNLLINQ